MKSKYLCERCKVKNCSGYVESSTNPLETFHFCPKFAFDDGAPFSQADRIRSLSNEQLIEFLTDFDIEDIYSDFCKSMCKRKDGKCPVESENKSCNFTDEEIMKSWIESEVANE